MSTEADDILGELFHGCALTAFLEQAQAERGWPDPEATRQRAYRLYEQALAVKNRSPEPVAPQPTVYSVRDP